MKKVRFTETQIISILKQQEAGLSIKDLARGHLNINNLHQYIRIQSGSQRRNVGCAFLCHPGAPGIFP